MKSKLLNDIHGSREWVIIFDPGDEAMAELKSFATASRLQAAHFTGSQSETVQSKTASESH